MNYHWRGTRDISRYLRENLEITICSTGYRQEGSRNNDDILSNTMTHELTPK